MFRSKKSLIRENEILKDRLEDVTQQLKNAVNKPPLKYPLKGFYWKYNKIAGIWEFVPYEDFSFNDIRILNGLMPVAKCPKYPMSERNLILQIIEKRLWRPASEKPDKSGQYLCTLWDKDGVFLALTEWNETFGGRWQAVFEGEDSYSDIGNVLAWMPLPGPYTESKGEDG